MNNYGQLILDRYRQHRPNQLERVAEPSAYFTTIGEEIQAAVTQLRDEIRRGGTPVVGRRPWLSTPVPTLEGPQPRLIWMHEDSLTPIAI